MEQELSKRTIEQYSSYQRETEPSKETSGDTPKELADKYQFLAQIGQGAQGQVYKAKRLSDGNSVAIKLLRIDSVQNWKSYELFHRESEVLASLDIKGVAKFYESGEYLDSPKPFAYIAQEYIDGQSLDEMIKNGYRFPLHQVFSFAVEMVQILRRLHIHKPKVIHRDIKPKNVILKATQGDKYEVYLIDFGAVANPQIQGGGSTMAGTYGYMPPEQLMGTPEEASDTYALAATLVYMLCGIETGEMRVSDFRPVIDPHLQNIPNPIVCIMRMMLEPKLEERLSDLDKLERIFTSFSQNNYLIEDVPIKPMADFEKKLEIVERYDQVGNFDLWMQLSDKLPRTVPECYKYFAIIPFRKSEKNKIKHRLNFRKRFKKISFRFGVCSIVFFVLLSIDLISEHGMDGVSFALIISIILLIMALILGTLWIIITAMFKYLKKNTTDISSVAKEFMKDQDSAKRIRHEMEFLIKSGRKGVAVIEDISYCPLMIIDPNKKEEYLSNDKATYRFKRDNSDTSPFSSQIYNERPNFVIKYRFNPPDDIQSTDLIHQITVHQDYDENLVPGTPFPILYWVNPADNAEVMSMPFPATLWEVQQLDEVYCRTYNGRIKYEQFK